MKVFPSFRGITPTNSNRRYVDNIFDDFWNRSYNGSTMRDESLTIPSANIDEYSGQDWEGYVIALAAPGYHREELSIEYDDDILTLKGERQTADADTDNDHSRYRQHEYRYHNFTRQFRVPESVDEDNISANYTDGILQVKLPVSKKVEETPKPRRISIQ
ncbi:MAG: Hsp20/alpha crystallin family protein [Bacteroidota bacterium]